MSAALVAKVTDSHNAPFTTPSIDTTGASLIVIVMTSYTSLNQANLSDSKSNEWQHCAQYGSGNWFAQIHYAYNPTVGSGHTFTWNETAYKNMFVYAFSGMEQTDWVLEDSNGAQNSDGSSVYVYPSATGDLLVAAASYGSGGGDSTTVDGGFVIEDYIAFSSGISPGGTTALDLDWPSTEGESCTWTDVNSSDNAIVIAAFRAAPACVLSGSITSASESDIRAGGKQIVLTLEHDLWIPE